MKNPYMDANTRHDLRSAWKSREFTLDFTSRERYKRAVRVLMNSGKYNLLRNGRYLYGNVYGYVTFAEK